VGERVATTTGGAVRLATGDVVVGDSVVGGYVVGGYVLSDSVVGESVGDMGQGQRRGSTSARPPTVTWTSS
jgi:hypothetical protein